MAEIALPHSVWTLIFERLSLQELSRTSTVSQQWHKLIWSTVHDLTVPNKFRPKSDQKFSNASLEKIAVYCSNVRHLDLSGINGFTDEGVKSLGRLTSLRSLNLSRCLRISNSVLADVLSPMDSLQSLNVSFCTQFTDELFQKLAKSHKVSRSLTSLDVSFCINMTNQTLVGALVKFENLQAVALNGCDQLSRKAINEMIASLPKLDTLEVRWIQFKEPRRQDSPLFASPVRSTSSAKPLNVSYIPLSKEVIPKIVAQLASPNPRLQLEVAIALRMLLSCDSDPPIDAVVNAGAVPKLVNHLSCKDPMMQLEAVWSLTNIASGTSAHTQLIIDNHALPVFVKLTESKEPEMAAKAIWTLGNIAGDSVKFRDLVLHHGTLLALLYNMDVALSSNNITLLRNATWCLSNLSRGTPKPPFALFRPALPKLAMLLSHRDEEVVIDSCWAASYLSDGPNEHIEDMLQAGVIESVVRLLNKGPAASLTPALRTIGNVATGNDSQTQRLLSMGVLPNLLRFLSHDKKGILKETCWTISNITAGPAHHLQVLFDAGVMSAVLNLLRSSKDFDIKKEAAWAIGNATLTANSSQIESLVSLGCIHELVEFLGQADNNVGSVLLDALKNIMVHNKTKYLGIMRSLNKTSYFEELAHSENDDLCAKALDMISWLNGKYK